jgi:hypothetical protein
MSDLGDDHDAVYRYYRRRKLDEIFPGAEAAIDGLIWTLFSEPSLDHMHGLWDGSCVHRYVRKQLESQLNVQPIAPHRFALLDFVERSLSARWLARPGSFRAL